MMTRGPLLSTLLIAVAHAVAGAVEVREEGASTVLVNSHYRATISRQEGGVLGSLKTADGKHELLTAHRLYTDFGMYEERGHVGTVNEREPDVAVVRDAAQVQVTSSGILRGEPADGGGALPYKLVYTFDDSAAIHVRCEVVPFAAATDVRAFLASCFVVPQMSEWAANTADGVIREDFERRQGRNYESSKAPLDAEAPQVGFITPSGASLLVRDIAAAETSPLQSVIIHGNAFFVAWLSGTPTTIGASPLQVEFDLVVDRGDPMR